MTTDFISNLTGVSATSDTVSGNNRQVRDSGNSDRFGDIIDRQVDRSAGDRNEIGDRYKSEANGSEAYVERLEVLRSTVEGMDDSELVGFMAMLETQSGWAAENARTKARTDAYSTLKADPTVQNRITPNGLPADTRYGAVSSVLSTAPYGSAENNLAGAISAGLDKATESYIPAGREQGDTARFPVSDIRAEMRPGGELNDLSASNVQTVQTVRTSVSETFTGSLLRTEVMASGTASADPLPIAQESFSSGSQLQGDGRISAASIRHNGQTTAEYLNDLRPQTANNASTWSEALGQRLVTLVTDQRQEAQLRLDPPELGKLGIRLRVEEGGVSIQFQSSIPQVRELIESQSDRLRLAMEQQGMNLLDVNVGDDSGDDSGDESRQQNENTLLQEQLSVTDGSEMVMTELSLPVLSVPEGMISTFA